MDVFQSPWPKRRIGKQNDGGYVICDIPGEYDRFVSGGIDKDISFECALLDMYPNLKCDAFDGSIDTLPQSHERIVFHKTFLGPHEDLSAYIEPYSNVFLKIDIEGHELEVLPSLIQKGTIHKVKQLIVEFHSPIEYHLFPWCYVHLDGITERDMYTTMEELRKTHKLVHLHPNNGCAVTNNRPNVFECTYIRTMDPLPLSREVLPTPIDQPNCPLNARCVFLV
jgi:Methyltransferase FkbM domain